MAIRDIFNKNSDVFVAVFLVKDTRKIKTEKNCLRLVALANCPITSLFESLIIKLLTSSSLPIINRVLSTISVKLENALYYLESKIY